MSPPSKAGSTGNYGRGDGGRGRIPLQQTPPPPVPVPAAVPPTHALCSASRERKGRARSLAKGGEEKAAEGRRETYTHYAM